MKHIENKREQIKNIALKNPNLSAREIGKLVNLHRTTVNYHLRKLNIFRDRATLQKCNNTQRSFDIEISNEAEQIILGSILGDGTITKWKRCTNSKLNLNSSLTICHTSPQKDYLLYKKQLLEKYGIKCHKISIIPKERLQKYCPTILGKTYTINDRYSLSTRRAISFNKYRDLFYKDIKYINPYIKKLDNLGLAIWYMDDGYKHVGTYFLCTNCFDLESVKLLQEVLLENFNIETTLNKGYKGAYIIHIRAKSANLFKSKIESFICDSMKYKLYT